MAIYNVNKTTGDIVKTAGTYDNSSKVFYGNIASWNNLTTKEKKEYDHASITDSIGGGVTFPANKVAMTGGGNVEDALDEVKSDLIKPKYSSRIDISDYNSASNTYTAPTNGFILCEFSINGTTNTGYNIYIDGSSMYDGYNNVGSKIMFTAPIAAGSIIYTTSQSNVTAKIFFVPYGN